MTNRKSLMAVLAVLLMGTVSEAGDWINKKLPDAIKADLQVRYRLEYRSDFDFNESKDDNDAYNLYRTRLNLKFTPIKQLYLFTQAQDARITHSQFIDKSPYENFMDTRQLYLNYEDEVQFEPLSMNKVSLRAGRQEFAYGAERLIGGFNWSNVAQTFDGGKIGFHFIPLHLQVDFFGGDKTSIKSPREADDLFDGSSKDRMYAYYATAKPYKDLIVENYLIRRKTGKNISFGPSGSGAVDEFTFGGRLLKPASSGHFDYELETAGQWGDFNDKDVRAAMAVGIIGYTIKHRFAPRFAFEYDYGTGDSNPTDGTRRTFDNLYPTNHPFYGFMDLFSIQNLNDYRYQASFKPHSKWKLQSDYHLLFLDTPKDSFYSAGRAVTRTASASLSDVNPHVGDEVDLTAEYKATPWLNMLFGYSHFFAGKYLQETGANDDADFFYLQTQFTL